MEKAPLTNYDDLEKRLKNGDIRAAIEIPPGFGRDIERGRPAWVGAWIDGAMPYRAATIRGYLQAMNELYLTDPAVKTTVPAPAAPANIEIRYKYNQDFESVYAMVPTSISMLLALFPAILMALAIVREKELGSITNLYVTPVTRIEFLLGKQLPYIGVAVTNFAVMFLMAFFVFQVPLKGSFPRSLGRSTDLRHDHDRVRDADLGVYTHSDRRFVWYCDPHMSCPRAILRHHGAGFVTIGDRPDHGASISDDVFCTHQRRSLHQGTRVP